MTGPLVKIVGYRIEHSEIALWLEDFGIPRWLEHYGIAQWLEKSRMTHAVARACYPSSGAMKSLTKPLA